MILYRDFPRNAPYPMSDAEARAMGCIIYRGWHISMTNHELTETVTYQYPQPKREIKTSWNAKTAKKK